MSRKQSKSRRKIRQPLPSPPRDVILGANGPDPVEDTLEDLAYQAAYQATLTQGRYALLEARAVRLGREGGVSWDKIGVWLMVPGETLRRRYGMTL